MSSCPTVSVIIPTYNHAHFLKDALRSVCNQTYADWEAIVINNYSEDDTVAVVASFDDPRIVLENFHNNGVIGASRNRGIALARGKYIAFLDSDDIWYSEKLSRCIAHFNGDVALVCHGLRWMGSEEKDVFCGPEQRATFESLLYEGNCMTPTATVVRKDIVDLVGGFSEDAAVMTAEDYHLWLKLARAGCKMRFPREILGGYRVHSGNQSGAVVKHFHATLQVLEEFFPKKELRDFQSRLRVRRRYAIAYYGAARAMQRNKKIPQSWLLLLQSIVYWPIFLRSYVAIAWGIVMLVIGRGGR